MQVITKRPNHMKWSIVKSICITFLLCNFLFLFIHKSSYSFIEYRPFSDFNKLSPWLTIEKAEKEFYLGIGILLDIKLNDYWIFTPIFGAGYYDKNNGIDLGSFLEFRSSFEIARPFKNESRLGLGVGHYSNANLGYKNPGSESLKLTYSIPF